MKLNYIDKLIKLKWKEIIFCIYEFLWELNEIKILINPNSSFFYLLRKALNFNLKLNLIN